MRRRGECGVALSDLPVVCCSRRAQPPLQQLSRRLPPLLLLLLLTCWGSGWRQVDALVSYCRDPSPHSYSHAQAETICDIEGEYNFKTVVDNSNQKVLYGDLGEENARRRYTAMTPDDKIVAKYANMSEFILHVQVISANETSPAHHCCQVCYLDCEQFRYSCPRTNVDANDSCTADPSQVTTCRFTESVLQVKVRVVCAVKTSASRPIPERWFTEHFFLRTARPGCPYRKLENGAYYLLMATLSTPNYGTSDTLVGADMVIAIPKKSKTLPASFLRGVTLQQSGYLRLSSSAARNDSYCPSESALRLPRSGAATPRGAGRAAAWASAIAASAAAVVVAVAATTARAS